MTNGTFMARVKGGEVVWSDPKAAARYRADLEGQQVIITVAPRRNLDQNAAFYALCNECAEYGYSPAHWKAFFKAEYLADPVRSTADLTHDEMGGLLEFATCWVAEHLGAPRERRTAA